MFYCCLSVLCNCVVDVLASHYNCRSVFVSFFVRWFDSKSLWFMVCLRVCHRGFCACETLFVLICLCAIVVVGAFVCHCVGL